MAKATAEQIRELAEELGIRPDLHDSSNPTDLSLTNSLDAARRLQDAYLVELDARRGRDRRVYVIPADDNPHALNHNQFHVSESEASINVHPPPTSDITTRAPGVIVFINTRLTDVADHENPVLALQTIPFFDSVAPGEDETRRSTRADVNGALDVLWQLRQAPSRRGGASGAGKRTRS